MMEHVKVHSDSVIASNGKPFRQLHSPLVDWPSQLHKALNNGPFILCCDKCIVMAIL